jgi:hypothetical protein
MSRVNADLQTTALERLARCKSDEPEGCHVEADKVLCELLVALGYKAVVEAWTRLEKWYA